MSCLNISCCDNQAKTVRRAIAIEEINDSLNPAPTESSTNWKVALVVAVILLALGATAGIIHGTIGWDWMEPFIAMPNGLFLALCIGSVLIGSLSAQIVRCCYSKFCHLCPTLETTAILIISIIVTLGISLAIVYGVNAWENMVSWLKAPMILPQGVFICIGIGGLAFGALFSAALSASYQTHFVTFETI